VNRILPTLFGICVLAAPGFAQTNATLIRGGSELDFQPYCFTDKDGRPTGFGVELLRTVADRMGLRLEMTPGPWDKVWSDLVAGNIDVLPVVARTPGREPLVDFGLPHTETFDAFFVREGRSPPKDLAAAAGKEIVVLREDAAHHELMERNFAGKIIPVESLPDGLRLIAAGQHDALLCPKLIGTLEIQEHGIRDVSSGPVIPDYRRVFSFAVRKGNPELVEKLDQGLRIVKATGEYDRLYRKWLGLEQPPSPWQTDFWRIIGMLGVVVLIAATSVVARKALAAEGRAARGLMPESRGTRDAFWRYALAVVATAAAYAVRVGLEAWAGPGLPIYITFYPAVMAVALLAGAGPGLLTTALTASLVAWAILPPVYSLAITSPIDSAGLVLFLSMGVFMSSVAGLYRRSRAKAAAYEREQALRDSQAEVRRSEALLRAVMDNCPDSIFLKGRDGRLLMANAATLAVIGKSAEQVIGKTDVEFYDDPATARAIMENDRRVMASDQMEAVEETAPGPDGPHVYLSSKAPFRDADGRVIGLIGVARDITERKRVEEEVRQLNAALEQRVSELQVSRRAALNLMDDAVKARRQAEQAAAELQREVAERRRAEETLRRSEAALQDAQRVAHVGSWYWDATTDVTTGSDELLRIYGLDPVTQSMPAFKEQDGRLYPHESWQRVNAAVQNAVQTGTGYELDVQALRDGTAIWITTRGEVVRDADGRIVGMRGTVQDITERKRAEEAVQASRAAALNLMEDAVEARRQIEQTAAELEAAHAQIEAVVQHLDEGVVVADLEGRLLQWNPAALEMHGFNSLEEAHRLLPELTDTFEISTLDGIVLAVDQWPLARVLRGETIHDLELRVRRIDTGRQRVFDYGGTLVWDAQGRPFLALVTVNDITERKHAEEALRESEERVRRKLDSVLSPEGDIGNLELADIIDAPAIQSILEDFYEVARIPMAILDLKGNVLIGVGWQDICTKFHRAHPETVKHCLESDTELSCGVCPGQFRLYKCKNNMWDMATPILVGGQHLGNLFAGQFFFEDESPDYDLFRSQARQYGFDEQEYIAALDAAPRLDRRLVDTGMGFFIKLAALISHLSYGNVKLARLLAERERIQAKILQQTAQLEEQTRIADLASLFVRDLQGRVVYWNTGVQQLYGFTKEEAVGRVSHDLLQTVFPGPLEHIEAKLLSEGRWEGELIHTRRDGTKVTISSYWVLHKDAEGRPHAILEVNSDITAIKEAERALRESTERFRLLSEVSGRLLETDNPRALVEALCRKVMEHLDCHIFVNYLIDEQARRLHLNATGGLPDKTVKAIEWLDFGQAICGRVAQEGQRIVAENIQESCDTRADLVRSFGIKAYACHPIIAMNRVIGTLSFGTCSRKTFSDDDLALMKTVTDQVATAMERMRAQQALQELNEQLEQRVRERTAELRQTMDLVESERRRFKAVLDDLPVYVALLTPDYHVPLANRFFEERFGRSEGRRCYEYLFNRTEPCEICETFKVLKTHEPHQWEWTGPDGHNYEIHDFPFTDVDGSPLIMEVGLDITDRKKAEKALHLASAYNRSLIEASLDPLVTINAEGKITDVNAAAEKATGCSRQELIGTDFSDYFTEPDRARAGYLQVFREGSVQDYALELRNRYGQSIPVLYNASVYRDAAGEVMGVFAAARDITERKRVEEELRRLNDELEQRVAARTAELAASNRELEAFAYSVSHDLRAPLRAMDGFSQAVLEDHADKLDRQGKDHLRRVRAASQRMGQMIDGILSLSRTARSEMECTAVDLSLMAETIAGEMVRAEPARQVQFVIEPHMIVYADANLLRIMLENLIGNAWKFTSKHPQARIEVGTTQQDGQKAYFVRDDGAGFDMTYANNLFGAFRRLHTNAEFEGTGVGLATVQRIIHRHGGRVWAEGHVEKGAVFFFTLPDGPNRWWTTK
jgi:PAS domain S-box-containing protein